MLTSLCPHAAPMHIQRDTNPCCAPSLMIVTPVLIATDRSLRQLCVSQCVGRRDQSPLSRDLIRVS